MDRTLLIRELERDEGVVLHAYRDSLGKTTIGIGRLLDAPGGITLAEARYLLDNDLARVELELDAHIGWWRSLDDVRQRVLMNMCFNLGIEGLLGFKRTLSDVKAGHYEQAAKDMLDSRWATQVGRRAERLAAMMRTGVV